jgi:hypothetical protein
MNTNRVDALALPRRTVLQGALVLGCGLLVPPVLASCDSRTSLSPASDAPPETPGTRSVNASAAPAAAKVPQASVKYQNQPKGDQSCGVCTHFIPGSNTCKLVEGSINPNGWCTLWARKA